MTKEELNLLLEAARVLRSMLREATAAIAAMNHDDSSQRARDLQAQITWINQQIAGGVDLRPVNKRGSDPRTYEDGLRRAAEIVTALARISSNSRDVECYDTAASAILSELGHPPQPSRDDAIRIELTNLIYRIRSTTWSGSEEIVELIKRRIAEFDNAGKPEGEKG